MKDNYKQKEDLNGTYTAYFARMLLENEAVYAYEMDILFLH